MNLLWTPLYFGLGRPIAASLDILALGGTVACLANVWGQVDPACGWLLAPYLGWLSFATYLCVSAITFFTRRHMQLTQPGRIRLSQQLGFQVCLQEGLNDDGSWRIDLFMKLRLIVP